MESRPAGGKSKPHGVTMTPGDLLQPLPFSAGPFNVRDGTTKEEKEVCKPVCQVHTHTCIPASPLDSWFLCGSCDL